MEQLEKSIEKYYDFLKSKTIIETIPESDWVILHTPYIGLYNDSISISIKKDEDRIVMSDDGIALKNLMINILDKKYEKLLRSIIFGYDVKIEYNKELMVYTTEEDFAQKLYNLISAIQEIHTTVAALYADHILNS